MRCRSAPAHELIDALDPSERLAAHGSEGVQVIAKIAGALLSRELVRL